MKSKHLESINNVISVSSSLFEGYRKHEKHKRVKSSEGEVVYSSYPDRMVSIEKSGAILKVDITSQFSLTLFIWNDEIMKIKYNGTDSCNIQCSGTSSNVKISDLSEECIFGLNTAGMNIPDINIAGIVNIIKKVVDTSQ